MSIFDFIRRYRQQRQRRNEMEVHRKIAEATRKASTFKRQADRLKAEAIQLEKAGDHQRAVATAALAVQQEKNHQNTLLALQNCKIAQVQVKSRKEMKETIAAFTSLIRDISADADPAEYMEVQNEFTRTMEELEESRDALEAVQEGFSMGMQEQVRNEAGEQALAQIMEQQEPKEAPAPAEVAAALPEPKQDPKLAQHKEWAEERRKILAEMV